MAVKGLFNTWKVTTFKKGQYGSKKTKCGHYPIILKSIHSLQKIFHIETSRLKYHRNVDILSDSIWNLYPPVEDLLYVFHSGGENFKWIDIFSKSIWNSPPPQSFGSLERFSRAGPKGRGREWATLGVHPLSWLLSNNRLEEVCGTLTTDTFSNRLLLSNQDKGCTPSVAHSLPLPLGPALLNLWNLTQRVFMWKCTLG